jgi:hypothetical protein
MAAFALQSGRQSHEASAICLYCAKHGIERRFIRPSDPLPEGWIPVGTVEFCEGFLPYRPTPDYAPAWLRPLLYRNVWITESPPAKSCWIKPADKYKRFDAFFYSPGDRLPGGPYFCSEPLPEIIHEWRYYLAEGSAVAAGWYDGADPENTPPAPKFPASAPSSFTGAVDLAETSEGTLCLIECHHPYACGWYGPLGQAEPYAKWLTEGWQRLNQAPH